MKTLTTTKPLQDDQYALTLEKLRLKGVRVAPRNAWQRSFGRMKDCDVHAEAVKAGAEWRHEMNQQSLEELGLAHGHT